MEVQLAIVVAQLLLKYGPEAARAFRNIFTKKDPTDADWDALFIAAESNAKKFLEETKGL